MIPLYHLLKCSKKKNDVKFYFFSREQTTTPTTISRIFAARRVGMTSGRKIYTEKALAGGRQLVPGLSLN